MIQRSVAERAGDMIDARERSVSYLGSLDLTGLATDQMRIDAIVRVLEIVGEACKHVTQTVRDRFLSISWKLIAGMRDRLIHGYDDVDLAVVWETVTRFIPPTLPELRKIRDTLLAEERTEPK